MLSRFVAPASRLAVRAVLPRASPLVAAARPSLASSSRSAVLPSLVRAYSAAEELAPSPDNKLTKENVEARILDIFKGFDKVKQDKLSLDASFTEDLGLDSLDAVEVIMAIEEDFYIEIPDAEADEIRTVRQAVDYILRTPEAGL